MPDVSDAPDGVHPHIKMHLTDHPDGKIMLWVKQKFHVMHAAEARALARELRALADKVDPPANGVAVVPDVTKDVAAEMAEPNA